MPINLKAPKLKELKPRIVVCGVGGAGGNAINNISPPACPGSTSSSPTLTRRARCRVIRSASLRGPSRSRHRDRRYPPADNTRRIRLVVTNLPYSDLEELATHLIGLGVRDRCGTRSWFAPSGSSQKRAADWCTSTLMSPAPCC